MLAPAGVTAIEVIAFVPPAVTVNGVVPVTPLREAVTLVEPAATPVARPLELMVAIAVLAAVQVAVELMFAVEASLYVAVAVNCCVAPTAMLKFPGVTAIEVIVFPVPPVTLSVVVPLMPLMPLIEALTVVDPAATPVARPLELTVAIAVLAAAQVAVELRFAVDPSL
jgi:hypothetical protein